ncbi:metallophosphoesterase family protein [Allobacillus sp. GCM10007491]|uniref:Serine/threonine protein phosphatase n=1 Tax=Allobacillus saliphilus TaxID=2912308 RepID=A0A941CT49_9BACI|nr:metallophosphoesterase family protein [Allobacillus saliphilus]MBR7552651.1 serine/threonine protein phosphatase [Allobacillus saliphilus]
MNRNLMISDIHGHLNAFEQLLEKVDFQPASDQLILLGDYIDRGPSSKETIEFVMDLQANGTIALRGNHDDWFLQWLQDPSQVSPNFLLNGGIETIQSYIGELGDDYSVEAQAEWASYIRDNYPTHVDFLKELPLYYEHEELICVHAGIDPLQANWKNTSKENFLWIRKEFHNSVIDSDKTIIFGHTPTKGLQAHAHVYFDNNKIGIDGGYTFGYQLNCLIYERNEFTEVAVTKEEVEDSMTRQLFPRK